MKKKILENKLFYLFFLILVIFVLFAVAVITKTDNPGGKAVDLISKSFVPITIVPIPVGIIPILCLIILIYFSSYQMNILLLILAFSLFVIFKR